MAHNQIPLIPVSDRECTQASYQLARLMEQDEEADAIWEESKRAHKETKATYRKAMAEKRAIIRRHQREAQEGLTQAQIDVMLMHDEEQRP